MASVRNPLSDFITEIQQALSRIDGAAALIYGIYGRVSRICEMNPDWTPATNEDGTFKMKLSDQDLTDMGFGFTAQQLGQTVFAAIEIANSISPSIADLIAIVKA